MRRFVAFASFVAIAAVVAVRSVAQSPPKPDANGGAGVPAGKAELQVKAGPVELTVYTYRPVKWSGERLLIVMHGVLRNADEYPALCDVVGVTICNFNLWPEQDERGGWRVPMLSRWRMQEQHSGERGLPQVQYAFLELPKYAAGNAPEALIDRWAYFFREAKNLTVVEQGIVETRFRGNVVDLAVGIVIGAAFTNIVQAVVKDLITPLLGIFGGGPNLAGLSFMIAGQQFQLGDVINALISFLLAHWIVRPIAGLTAIADKVTMGDLETSVSGKCVSSRDEIGDLARSLERMRSSLKAAMMRLGRETA